MADTFCGFDIDLTAALVRELGNAAAAAGNLSTAVGRIADEANQASLRALPPQLRRAEGFDASQPGDDIRSGLTTVATTAQGVATETGRRRTQLIACQTLVKSGLTIDPEDVFLDEKPPDPAKIKAALASVRHGLTTDPGMNGNHDDLQHMTQALTGLTDAETDAVIQGLSDKELKAWNSAITKGDGWIADNGLSNDERVALANMLLLRTGSAAVRRLAVDMVSLHPKLGVDDPKNYPGLQYALPSGSLFGPNGVDVENDVAQGDIGDCWFVSAIASIAQADPAFIGQHITSNPNGTYTVLFYKDGKPEPVTVTPDLPLANNGAWIANAGAEGHSASGSLWLAIYEKAYAQLRGGYKAIPGGEGSVAYPTLTGRSATQWDPGHHSLADVAAALKSGAVMTAGTADDKVLWVFGGSELFDHNQLVTLHEYRVTSVNTAAHPPTITLTNPWGRTQQQAPYQVTLSQDDFRKYFTEISVGAP